MENIEEKTLDEIIQEIADEEGMSFDETKKLFKQGLRVMNNKKAIDSKKKAKTKAKKKQAKKSRNRNR